MPFKRPKFSELTSTQKNIISCISIGDNSKYAVIGGPGTGKTILALQIILDAIKSTNDNVLFIVYNRPLAKFIASEAKKSNNNSTISTFHSWIYNFIRYQLKVDPTYYQTKMFVYDWDKLYTDLINNKNLKGYYDYIFVDEAQDLHMGAWKIIKYLSKNINVFYDDNQRIGNDDSNDYDYSKVDVKSEIGCEENFFDLIDNFRNTKQIECVAKLFGDNYDDNNVTLKKTTAIREGQKPVILHSNSIDDTVKYILKHFNPGYSYGVLVPQFSISGEFDNQINAYAESFNKQMTQSQKQVFQCYKSSKSIQGNNNYEILDTGISLMSIKASKGLEFDVVYIVETNNPNLNIKTEINRHRLYVAITRARNNLFFVLNEGLPANDVEKLLESHKDCFEEQKVIANDFASKIRNLF